MEENNSICKRNTPHLQSCLNCGRLIYYPCIWRERLKSINRFECEKWISEEDIMLEDEEALAESREFLD